MSIRNCNDIPKKPLLHDIIWMVCRVSLLLWGTVHFFFGYTTEFLQGIFATIFTYLWDMFQLWGGKSFITKLSYRCQTQLNIFICVGCVIGTTLNKHTEFTYSDIFLHFMAGYISATGMYELSKIMQGKGKETGPAMKIMFMLTGAVAILVGWEFYEFSMDRIYGMRLQCTSLFSEYGLVDTMWDLIIGSIGALCSMFVQIISLVRKNRKIS